MQCCKSLEHLSFWIKNCSATRTPSSSITGHHLSLTSGNVREGYYLSEGRQSAYSTAPAERAAQRSYFVWCINKWKNTMWERRCYLHLLSEVKCWAFIRVRMPTSKVTEQGRKTTWKSLHRVEIRSKANADKRGKWNLSNWIDLLNKLSY